MSEITMADMKKEALKRMKMLKICKEAIDEFKNEDKLNYSEDGFLYWLEGKNLKLVKDWEEDTGNLAYHAIFNHTEIGDMLTVLYVSKEADEWEMDREDIRFKSTVAYVFNLGCDYFSEYGSVGIMPRFGGVLRTA